MESCEIKTNKNFKFLILVLVLSIPFNLLNLFYKEKVLINLPISFLMIVVPFLLAIYFSYRDNAFKGLKELFIESHRIKKGSGRWLALSMIILPITFSLAGYIDNNFDPNIYSDLKIKYFGLFILLYIGAFLEELGWTTYLTKDMQNSYGILKTGLIIGLVWGLWHLFPYIAQGKSWDDIIILIGLSVLYRIVMGYLYNYSSFTSLTGILFHTMINFVPETMIRVYDTYRFSTFFIILLLIVILFYIFDRRKIS